ncbi:MAG: class I SAM-dependent methyltransferase [bacterium]|nr:class I SAM-dependent methyltransferase [bacterium]
MVDPIGVQDIVKSEEVDRFSSVPPSADSPSPWIHLRPRDLATRSAWRGRPGGRRKDPARQGLRYPALRTGSMKTNEPTDRNPQARQMSDESLVRGLAAQADASWPQESEILDRYGLPAAMRVLDVGCGTGEIMGRLARRFPSANRIGIGLIGAHLDQARERHADIGERIRFASGDAFDLGFDEGTFDLVLCRHMFQSVPQPRRVLAEMLRVVRPGG